MRIRCILLPLVLVLAAGCGSDQTTVEYAEDVERLVVTMNARLDQLDAEAEGTSDLGVIQNYAKSRVGARSAFVAGLRELQPPTDVKPLHDEALEIMARLMNAESAMADVVMQWKSAADIDDIWNTPEGIAARTADARAVAMCLVAQEEFDQTADRAEFQDVPWIPGEMKAVILVAFGCEADSR